jgi:hypothetical protein
VSVPSKEGLLFVWAFILAAIVLFLPISSPDLFWHLSAGRWMSDHLALIRTDFLSFTREGVPWINFEWGLQLIWSAIFALGGLWGLGQGGGFAHGFFLSSF